MKTEVLFHILYFSQLSSSLFLLRISGYLMERQPQVVLEVQAQEVIDREIAFSTGDEEVEVPGLAVVGVVA